MVTADRLDAAVSRKKAAEALAVQAWRSSACVMGARMGFRGFENFLSPSFAGGWQWIVSYG